MAFDVSSIKIQVNDIIRCDNSINIINNNNYNNKVDKIIDPTNRSELAKNNYSERTKAANLRTDNYRRNRDPWISHPK